MKSPVLKAVVDNDNVRLTVTQFQGDLAFRSADRKQRSRQTFRHHHDLIADFDDRTLPNRATDFDNVLGGFPTVPGRDNRDDLFPFRQVFGQHDHHRGFAGSPDRQIAHGNHRARRRNRPATKPFTQKQSQPVPQRNHPEQSHRQPVGRPALVIDYVQPASFHRNLWR